MLSSICVAVITGDADLDAVADDLLLQVGHVLQRALDAEVAAGDHDRVGLLEDRAQAVHRGRRLDLGHQARPDRARRPRRAPCVEIVRRRARTRRRGSRRRRPTIDAWRRCTRSSSVGVGQAHASPGRCTPGAALGLAAGEDGGRTTASVVDAVRLCNDDRAVAEDDRVAGLEVVEQASGTRRSDRRSAVRRRRRRATRRTVAPGGEERRRRRGTSRRAPSGRAGRRGRRPSGRPRRTARGSPPAGSRCSSSVPWLRFRRHDVDAGAQQRVEHAPAARDAGPERGHDLRRAAHDLLPSTRRLLDCAHGPRRVRPLPVRLPARLALAVPRRGQRRRPPRGGGLPPSRRARTPWPDVSGGRFVERGGALGGLALARRRDADGRVPDRRRPHRLPQPADQAPPRHRQRRLAAARRSRSTAARSSTPGSTATSACPAGWSGATARSC